MFFINKIINKNNKIDNLYIFKSSQNLKKYGYNNDTISPIKKIKLKSKIPVYLYGDSLFKIKLKFVKKILVFVSLDVLCSD